MDLTCKEQMVDPSELFYQLDNHHFVNAELLFDGQEEQKQFFINSQTLAKVNQTPKARLCSVI